MCFDYEYYIYVKNDNQRKKTSSKRFHPILMELLPNKLPFRSIFTVKTW